MNAIARHRGPAALAVAVALTGLAATACGFDSSSSAEQRRACRAAEVGHTSRATIHAALGGRTTTQHETILGDRRVVDIYLDGHVGFSFDRATAILRDKDCAADGA